MYNSKFDCHMTVVYCLIVCTIYLTDDKVPTELKKAIMQARMDKKLTQAQVAQVWIHIFLVPITSYPMFQYMSANICFINKLVMTADDKWETPDHTGVWIRKSNSESADHLQTGEGSWCKTAWKEINKQPALTCKSGGFLRLIFWPLIYIYIRM